MTSDGDRGPRLDPVSDADLTDRQRAALEPLGPMGGMHIFRTLAAHPRLLSSWLPFGGRLLQGSTLTPRVRELVILRTAALCGSDYEWGQHVGIGRDAGLSDDEMVACSAPASDGPWTGTDLAVAIATEQLVTDHRMGDHCWQQLLDAGWSDEQLIELTMLAGHYAMLAGMLRSVGVETERPLPRVGAVEIDGGQAARIG